ncbi:MAG: porin [Planctomycetes bacterium]|nr:porin [Planctomycetota bacterium]
MSAPTTIGLLDAETLECQSEQLHNDCNSQQDVSDEEVEPWSLFANCCRLQRNGMVAGGAISQGFTWNPDSPDDRSNGTLAYNDRSNEYQFNQLHFYLEKPLDDDSDCFHIGGMVEAFYGTDALFNQTIGLDDDWDSGRYGFILPQSYLSLFVPVGNGITVKLGHFWGLLGYEGTAALDRHFYSSSNTNNILEPNTDTGVQLSYGFDDNWSLVAAVTRGLDVWDDGNNRVGFTASLGWESDDGDTSISYALYYDGLCLSCSPVDQHIPQYLASLVVEQKLSENLMYVFWHDHGFADDPAMTPSNASWYSIVQYLLYEVNDCWTANARLEWVRDQDGFLMASSTGDLWGMTLGLNYKPTANLVYRPEIRWDWSDGLTPPLFDDHTRNNQFTFAVDVVWIY